MEGLAATQRFGPCAPNFEQRMGASASAWPPPACVKCLEREESGELFWQCSRCVARDRRRSMAPSGAPLQTSDPVESFQASAFGKLCTSIRVMCRQRGLDADQFLDGVGTMTLACRVIDHLRGLPAEQPAGGKSGPSRGGKGKGKGGKGKGRKRHAKLQQAAGIGTVDHCGQDQV